MIRFGIQLWPEKYNINELKGICPEVEELKYDSMWIPDHFYPMSTKIDADVFDAWTLLPILAAETERIRIGALVTCNSYRFPPVLAKLAATVDDVSRGRLNFGIGAGWYKKEYDAYGIEFPTAKTRIEQLAEAVELTKMIWREESASYEGRHYRIKDHVSYPKPVQKPHPPIWIGGKGDRLLRVTAQHADYANIIHSPIGEYRRRLDVLKRHCSDVERKYNEIQKTWFGFMIIAEEREARRKLLKFSENSVVSRVEDKSIAGSPEKCVEEMHKFVDLGVSYFIMHFPFKNDREVFMDQVASSFM